MNAPSLDTLIARGDLDELVREADRRAGRGDWDGLLALADRCQRAAEEVGKQLWGAAQYAEYRCALEAPGAVAASVLRPGAARFAVGPLTEVAASTHTWAELVDAIAYPMVAATVAHERAIRGEDLTGDPRAHPAEVEIPLVLQPWEPDYPLPVYRPDGIVENGPRPLPADASPTEVVPPPPGRPRGLPHVAHALREVTRAWTEQSSGTAHLAVVDGDGAAAVAALLPGRMRMARIPIGVAVEHLAAAGATGGAHGRRRGMAAGRSAAWWVAHAVADLAWPADPDELEYALEERRWYLFDDGAPEPGWTLRLAVEDPDGGWAAAIDAHDHRPEAAPA